MQCHRNGSSFSVSFIRAAKFENEREKNHRRNTLNCGSKKKKSQFEEWKFSVSRSGTLAFRLIGIQNHDVTLLLM